MQEGILNKNLSRLSSVADDINKGLDKLGAEISDGEEKTILQDIATGARELFHEMSEVVNGIVKDMEDTEEKLKESADKFLGQVSKQLDKVNESTQSAVTNMLDRIDNVSERQNDVSDHLGKLKKIIGDTGKDRPCENLMDCIKKIESLESEIQMEIFEMMNEMQFQDITEQQINHANQLIEEAKIKLLDFRKILSGLTGKAGREELEVSGPRTKAAFDTEATMENRENRQSLADELSAGFQEWK
ncbi:MAG: hypothetical protein U9N45_00565 [Gemmatimonadota bacterium]|nr:hypothetical protein [Gemmatimonadota bacterium]